MAQTAPLSNGVEAMGERQRGRFQVTWLTTGSLTVQVPRAESQ